MLEIIRIIFNWVRDISCPRCHSRNIVIVSWSVVNPKTIEGVVYIAEGYGLAAQLELKSAEGNYKRNDLHVILQMRRETYRCKKCKKGWTGNREVVIASDY